MSTFSGLNTALSALHAQRRGLDVTGQNIANANTTGYTRQRADLQSVGAPSVPALWSRYDGAGDGVRVDGIERVRDAFLEGRAREARASLGQLQTQQSALASVERVVGSTSGPGVPEQLTQLWKAWGDLASSPDAEAPRSAVIQRAGVVVDGLRAAGEAIDAEWGARREQLDAVVADVNATAASVAELNAAIRRSTVAGVPAGELSDRRDQLVLKLATAVGGTARSGPDGTVDVSVGGVALVSGATARALATEGPASLDALRADPTSPPRVVWASDGSTVMARGTAGGQVEALGATLPAYAARFDRVAAELAAQVNAVHAGGKDRDGGAAGPFFTGSTTRDLALASTDPRRIAASGPEEGANGNRVARQLSQLGIAPGGPDAAFRRLAVDLGVEAQTATTRLGIQAEVTAQADAAREAVAGVNLDEEMVNLISFQRAYESAARVMTTVDATLDTLINRTGLVGR